jgi:hypothetical protein
MASIQYSKLAIRKEGFMKTLKEILSGNLEYSSSWTIIAQEVNGEIVNESPAEFISTEFVKNGIKEGWQTILNNAAYCDWFTLNNDEKLFHYATQEEKEKSANWYINEVFYSNI